MEAPARCAGEMALSEIRARVEDILDALDQPGDEFDPEFGTREQVVADLLNSLVRRFDGSYWFGGRDGLSLALAEPQAKPFVGSDWL